MLGRGPSLAYKLYSTKDRIVMLTGKGEECEGRNGIRDSGLKA